MLETLKEFIKNSTCFVVVPSVIISVSLMNYFHLNLLEFVVIQIVLQIIGYHFIKKL